MIGGEGDTVAQDENPWICFESEMRGMDGASLMRARSLACLSNVKVWLSPERAYGNS